MKKLGLGVVVCAVCLTVASACFAGPMTRSSKEYKAPVEEPQCFGDHEFQADIFGAYGVTEEGQGAIMRDHGWGGGVGLNYFFTRWFGLGVDGCWLDVKPGDSHRIVENGETHTHVDSAATGSIILRYPIDRWCLAPYMFVGGGAQWSCGVYGSAHAGAGLEYRIIPQKLGIFVDGRCTVLADKSSVPISNPHFTLIRAGVRFVF